MLNLNHIVEVFKPLVGWKRGSYVLTEQNMESESGLYFQEAHPLLTLRALKGIMPKDFVYNYDAFVDGESYKKGDKVQYQNKAYIALVDNAVANPTDTSVWSEYEPFNDYLEYLEEVGIKEVVNRYIAEKVVNYETKNIVDKGTFFDGVGNINARTTNSGRLVGFEISPLKLGGAVMKAEKVGIQMVGNRGKVKVYLFHSSQSEPIWEKECDYQSSNGSMQWFTLDETFFSFLRENREGSYYLCYYQNELPDFMEAINIQRDWSKGGCSTCNRGNAAMWAQLNKWVTVSPFYVDDFEGVMWDAEQTMYTPGNNYGLNLQFSLGCDLTSLIEGEREQFARAIQLQVAVDALKALVFNPEVAVNRTQVNADRQGILYALDGDGQSVRGLNGELKKAYKELDFSTKGIDPICLTCRNKGIRVASI